MYKQTANTELFPQYSATLNAIPETAHAESPYAQVEQFLQRYPERMRVIERIMERIEFGPFFAMGGQVRMDFSLPMNVGGYYTYGGPEKIIGLNAWFVLFASEEEIAHVLVHEGLHAGVYTDGIELPEEVVTETVAKKAMEHYYGESGFRSGYDHMVDEMAPYFGAMTFPELILMIEEGTEETFDNFLELVVLGPLLDSTDPQKLSFREIEQELKGKWSMLQRLFPRMLTIIEGRVATGDATANMSAADFKLEGLLRKAADRLVQENRLQKTISSLLEQNFVESYAEAFAVIHLNGFAYLQDFYPEAVFAAINTYFAESPQNIEP